MSLIKIPEIGISPNHELRIYLLKSSQITICLQNGSAEINGFQLVQSQNLLISGYSSFAIFTFSGCQIKIEGDVFVHYQSKNCLYPQIRNLVLNDLIPLISNRPKFLLCGLSNSGKKTVLITLLNYLIRNNVFVIMVDLDVQSNLLTIPGAIAASVITDHIDAFQEVISPTLTTFVGSEHINKSTIKKYLDCVNFLFDAVKSILHSNNHSHLTKKYCVLVKCGSISDYSDIEIVEKICEKLDPNILISINLEWLNAKLKQNAIFSKTPVSIVPLPLSSAIPPVNLIRKSLLRSSYFRSYFYGRNGSLFPHTIKLKFGTFSIYKIKENFVPESVLPKGEKMQPDILRLTQISITKNLKNAVLGICAISNNEKFDFTVLGFVHITKVDEKNKILSLLSPNSQSLPTKKFISFGIQWIDQR